MDKESIAKSVEKKSGFKNLISGPLMSILKPKSSDGIEPEKKDETPSSVIKKIHKFMVVQYQEKLSQFEKEEKEKEKLTKIKEKRNEELIDLFQTKKRKRKKEEPKKETKKKTSKTKTIGEAAELALPEIGELALPEIEGLAGQKIEQTILSELKELSVSKFKTPEVKAPEVKVPEVKVPEVKAPEVKVSEVKAPGPTAKPAPKPTEAKPTAVKPITTGTIAGTTALVGRESLAANISQFESGAAGYNAYNKGTVGNKMIASDKPIDFSQMTISEYLRRGNLSKDDPDRLFAIGRYQIIPTTMKDLINQLHIDPNTTYLDSTTQDLLFTQGLTKTRRKAVENYISGKSDDKNSAILQLAQEFASVGIPYDLDIPYTDKAGNKQVKHLKKGDSYYSGIGGNKAHNPPELVGAALDSDRQKMLKQYDIISPPSQTMLAQKNTTIPDKMNKPSSSTSVASVNVLNNTTNVNNGSPIYNSMEEKSNKSSLLEKQYG